MYMDAHPDRIAGAILCEPARTLPVNIEDDIPPFIETGLDRGARCAIEVAEDFSGLKEGPGSLPCPELLPRQKEIMLPFNLIGAGRPCGMPQTVCFPGLLAERRVG